MDPLPSDVLLFVDNSNSFVCANRLSCMESIPMLCFIIFYFLTIAQMPKDSDTSVLSSNVPTYFLSETLFLSMNGSLFALF